MKFLLVVPSLVQDTQARMAYMLWARMIDEVKVVNLKFHQILSFIINAEKHRTQETDAMNYNT